MATKKFVRKNMGGKSVSQLTTHRLEVLEEMYNNKPVADVKEAFKEAVDSVAVADKRTEGTIKDAFQVRRGIDKTKIWNPISDWLKGNGFQPLQKLLIKASCSTILGDEPAIIAFFQQHP